jgi:hypothetical protein
MPTFINNTITANHITYTGGSYGGGMFVDWGTPSGQNNIIYGNSAQNGQDCYGIMFFNYSCSGALLSGTGNITDNPMFSNPTAGDYHLQADSPCIDTGDPASPLEPDSTRADMGAFYYDQSVSYPELDTIPLDFDAWLDVEYEGVPIVPTLVLRFFTNYLPGWTINRPGTWFPVPGSWSAGTYEMIGRAGNFPGEVWVENGFPFVKLGESDGNIFVPFFPAGDFPNPFDEITRGDSQRVMPVECKLLSAFPNPFNPSTVISYQLLEVSQVNLTVYDVAGRQVAELVNGWRDAGIHEVTFDASNLPSGVYSAQLNTGTTKYAQKLLLVK